VGGIIGYARTGSVPSIAAGLTVGALVSLPPSLHSSSCHRPFARSPSCIQERILTNVQIVRSRRLSHSEETAIRHRASAPSISAAGWIIYPQGDQDWKAASDRTGCAGCHRADRLRKGVLGLEIRGGRSNACGLERCNRRGRLKVRKRNNMRNDCN